MQELVPLKAILRRMLIARARNDSGRERERGARLWFWFPAISHINLGGEGNSNRPEPVFFCALDTYYSISARCFLREKKNRYAIKA